MPTPLQPAALAQVARATARDVAGSRCTTRQRNTHNTESREIRYPWHPWSGRLVTVYETVTKGGHPVCRCGIEDQRNDRSVEVPAWMFDAAPCDHLRLTTKPFVDCQALIELKAMLQTAPRADMLQHRTIPWLPQEVLMPRATRRFRVSQPTLFHPPPPRPHFQTLPADIQERTIRLLARLLRRHADQRLVAAEAQEARDE